MEEKKKEVEGDVNMDEGEEEREVKEEKWVRKAVDVVVSEMLEGIEGEE